MDEVAGPAIGEMGAVPGHLAAEIVVEPAKMATDIIAVDAEATVVAETVVETWSKAIEVTAAEVVVDIEAEISSKAIEVTVAVVVVEIEVTVAEVVVEIEVTVAEVVVEIEGTVAEVAVEATAAEMAVEVQGKDSAEGTRDDKGTTTKTKRILNVHIKFKDQQAYLRRFENEISAVRSCSSTFGFAWRFTR
jgi:hypothetical protein